MKLSTLAMTLSLAAISASSMASNSVLKPVNNKLETQACLVAGTEGLSAAKSLIIKEGHNFGNFKKALSCNGMSITKFSEKYQAPQAEEANFDTSSTIALAPRNNNAYSMVCVDAVILGELEARKKHSIARESVMCNDENIQNFVEKYQRENVIVRNSAK